MQGRCPLSECQPQCVLRAECGRARHCKRGCHCWQIKHGSDCSASATSLCSSGVFLLWPFAFGGRWNGDARMCRRLHDAPQRSTICDLALAVISLPFVRRQKQERAFPPSRTVKVIAVNGTFTLTDLPEGTEPLGRGPRLDSDDECYGEFQQLYCTGRRRR